MRSRKFYCKDSPEPFTRAAQLGLCSCRRSWKQSPATGHAIRAGAASFADADAGVLDHRPPLVHFRLEKLAELRWRRADHEQAELLETSLDRGIGQRGSRVRVYFSHDRRRRVGRHKEGIPSSDVETRSPPASASLAPPARVWRSSPQAHATGPPASATAAARYC